MSVKSVVSNFKGEKVFELVFVCLFFVSFVLIWYFYSICYLSHLRAMKIRLYFLKAKEIRRQWGIRIRFSIGEDCFILPFKNSKVFSDGF